MSPEDSPAIHGTEDDDFCAMFKPGDIYLFYAPKRAGKTTATLLLAYWAARHHNYRIASNIPLRKRDPAKFDGRGGWKHVYHTENYDYIDSYYDLFVVVEDFLRRRGPLDQPNPGVPQRLIFILDEATTSGIRMGQTTLNPLIQAAIGQAALSGHWAMVSIILTQSQELISAKFRGIESGLVTGFLTKPHVPGYTREEVLQFELQDPDEPFKKDGKTVNLTKYPIYLGELEGWARTPEMIRNTDGTYRDVPIFDTEAGAAFGMGNWPTGAGARGGKPFDLQGLMSVLAGEFAEDTPDLMRKYLRGEIGGPAPKEGDFEPKSEDEDEEEESEDDDEETESDTPGVKVKVKSEVVRLLMEGGHTQSEIGRLAGCSRQNVSQIKKELVAAGRL